MLFTRQQPNSIQCSILGSTPIDIPLCYLSWYHCLINGTEARALFPAALRLITRIQPANILCKQSLGCLFERIDRHTRLCVLPCHIVERWTVVTVTAEKMTHTDRKVKTQDKELCQEQMNLDALEVTTTRKHSIVDSRSLT
jgi:hypothetical protein